MRRHLKAKRILDSVTAAVFMIVLGISILILAISAAQPDRVAFGAQEFPAVNPCLQVVIAPGDTLWTLARQYYPNLDPRAVTFAIQAFNSLNDAVIYPGQVIAMPIVDGSSPKAAVVQNPYQ